jgi:hypothetical protein
MKLRHKVTAWRSGALLSLTVEYPFAWKSLLPHPFYLRQQSTSTPSNFPLPRGRSRSAPLPHQMESPNPDDPVETAVFRAGWLLKKLFLASRQRASCEATHKWEWDPEHTCLYIGRLIRPGEFLMFTSDVGITSSFAMTAEDQEVILSAHYSKEAVGFFSDLLKLLLQGKLPFQKCS